MHLDIWTVCCSAITQLETYKTNMEADALESKKSQVLLRIVYFSSASSGMLWYINIINFSFIQALFQYLCVCRHYLRTSWNLRRQKWRQRRRNIWLLWNNSVRRYFIIICCFGHIHKAFPGVWVACVPFLRVATLWSTTRLPICNDAIRGVASLISQK